METLRETLKSNSKMVIESKFDLREKVFYMENNKITSDRIISISYCTFIDKGNKEETSFHYILKKRKCTYAEPLLFKTKSELLKSL
jgi:hypothetical protein